MIDQAAYADALAEIEARYPVEQWLVEDLQAWPLLRVAALFAAISAAQPAARGARAQRALAACRPAPWLPRQRCAALLFGDGVSFVREADGWWRDRLLHPVCRGLQRLQRRWVMLQPGSPRPLATACGWAEGALLRACLRPPPISFVSLPAYREVAARLARVLARCPEERWLVALAARVLAARRWFSAVLEQVRPRAVFLVSYYHVYGWGLIAAARRQAIPSIDLQHGVQGRCNPAYAPCRRVPPGGYAVLPDHCWVWSEREAAALAAWATPGPRATVIGCPWIDEALSASPAPPPAPRRRVLVTLQHGLGEADYEERLRAALAALRSTDCELLVRAHPATPRAQLAALADRLQHPLRDPALPLWSELSGCAVHLTHSSSTVLEAELLGIPSIALSPLAAALYPEALASGALEIVSDLAALPARVRDLAARPAPLSPAARQAAARQRQARFLAALAAITEGGG
ncbi:MAG: hypothetical protein N3B15_06005 [Planctomycetota bacterium]|nr:hypothetical protein [Planctomycetota bacterium]MCX8040107.1 hypothetical protein [Planctomycetota bacterium]